MSKYGRKASALQEAVWSDEVSRDIRYDEELVRRSVVHARMDIVLLVSHLSSINNQLSVIKWIMAGILTVAIYIGLSQGTGIF